MIHLETHHTNKKSILKKVLGASLIVGGLISVTIYALSGNTEVKTSNDPVTLKQMITEQKSPKVSYFEVLNVEGTHGEVKVISKDKADEDIITLELGSHYSKGDVIAILWENDFNGEVAGSTKVASAGELDRKWSTGQDNNKGR